MVIDSAESFRAAALAAVNASRTSPLEEEVTALFDQWRGPLLGYLLTLGLPIQESEEVTQEVFLALFQHLKKDKSRENLRGWIFRVGHNLALKRRYGRASHLTGPLEQNDSIHTQDLSPNPEESLAMKQRQHRLLAVLEALPEQDRNCLHLRAEGLRYREIAEALGISLGGVSLSITRSLERLKRVDSR